MRARLPLGCRAFPFMCRPLVHMQNAMYPRGRGVVESAGRRRVQRVVRRLHCVHLHPNRVCGSTLSLDVPRVARVTAWIRSHDGVRTPSGTSLLVGARSRRSRSWTWTCSLHTALYPHCCASSRCAPQPCSVSACSPRSAGMTYAERGGRCRVLGFAAGACGGHAGSRQSIRTEKPVNI